MWDMGEQGRVCKYLNGWRCILKFFVMQALMKLSGVSLAEPTRAMIIGMAWVDYLLVNMTYICYVDSMYIHNIHSRVHVGLSSMLVLMSTQLSR